MATIQSITVKEMTIRTITQNGIDYICLTDIARQKNPIEPKDVVKNWMRSKNTIEYLGMWELLNNPLFKGVEFDPLLKLGLKCFYDESNSVGGTYQCSRYRMQEWSEWRHLCPKGYCL